MPLTKKALKELKTTGTKLDKKIINILLSKGSTSEIESYMKDVLKHGCQSGIVGELVYYYDTVNFYDKYKKDIDKLLRDTLDESGVSHPKYLFGSKWDMDDYFIEQDENKNLLAWFAFETTVSNILDNLGIEY